MTKPVANPYSSRQAGLAGAFAKWIKVRRHKPKPVIKIPASEVEIIGPLVGEGIPERGECLWIEGEDGQRYCGQPAGESSWCAYHAKRVVAPAGAVKRVGRWKLDSRG